MRTVLLFGFFISVPFVLAAQTSDTATSAASSWQLMRIQRSAVSESVASRFVAFDESFTDNRHHWPTGQLGGYMYEVAQEAYSIRRMGKRDGKSGRVFINLPDSLNLNRASSFVVEVEMVVIKGSMPEGGLLLGMRDQSNYTLFVLRNSQEFIIKRVVDGTTTANYLEGTYKSVDKPVATDTVRHFLRIEKHDDRLFYAIDGQDVSGGAILFRKFKGNGIGFISAGSAVSFQNLHISVGMP